MQEIGYTGFYSAEFESFFYYDKVLKGDMLTDVCFYRGRAASEVSFHQGVPFPLVLGHEPAGRVSTLGEGVDCDLTGRPLSAGDRVFVASLINCGRCYYCLVEGEPASCLNLESYAHKPLPDQPPHFQGGYAQYMGLWSNYHVLRMDGVEAEAVVMLEPLACGIHAVDRAEFCVPATIAI